MSSSSARNKRAETSKDAFLSEISTSGEPDVPAPLAAILNTTLPPTISSIFRDAETRHYLTLFSHASIDALEQRLFRKAGKPYLKCLVSAKDRPAKPEEIVRQLWLDKILSDLLYPKHRVKVERAVWFGSGVSEKSADIVILHEDGDHPYIIFEVKKPRRKDGLQQLKSYCNAEGSPIGVWSNGKELVVLHRDEPNIFAPISSIPTFGQTLQDVLTEQWTIDKLTAENKLVREKLSFKKLILDLEDLVLANAEGIDDSFDEVFKLIYAKLFDEWAAENDVSRARKIYFRRYAESPKELYAKITDLFNRAKDKWRGIFGFDEAIRLKPEHLVTCVSFLQDIKIFNANLQVIDEAFEYLITEVAKGKKGQYFTPRWVIDMCVKMLNPKISERMIDPACGSSGFSVHTIFHVAGELFSANGLPAGISEYAGNMIYGIDSSPKAVKIAKALNLIAGDGKSNVYELNSLNPPKWPDTGKAAFRPLLTRFPDSVIEDKANQERFQDFDFDLLMTNPPFAGKINEREILRQYRLAEKDGRTVDRMGRDILFIERSLRFLRPGGRMAIVLPQGRLNNASDIVVRNFLFNHGRVLAVVGLHVNTFKPHTGTKTSVVFLQKYTDDERNSIERTQSRHGGAWERHLVELRALAIDEPDAEGALPTLLSDFLPAYYGLFGDDDQTDIESQEQADELPTATAAELEERIIELEERLAQMVGRHRGKAAVASALLATRRQVAMQTPLGRLNWFLDDANAVDQYRRAWLADTSAQELDYKVFLAVSRQGGKDNRGEPIYKKGASGEIFLDRHGHLIIDTDLDQIANEFITFAKEQRLHFHD